jgi:pyruvate dehydrogenase kinase 2/3/4
MILRAIARSCTHRGAATGRTTPQTSRTWSTAAETSTLTSESDLSAHCHDRIPDDVADLIEEYTKKKQTCASLQTLMKTGRGESLSGHTTNTDKPNLTTPQQTQTPAFLGRMGQRLATQRIIMQDADFLRQEIPIRLAHRIRDLDRVPMMRDMPSVQAVKGIYVQSFLEMVDFPVINTVQEEQEFASMLEALYVKHANVLVNMARGAYQLREAVRSGMVQGSEAADHGLEFESMDQCHKFLDRFYMSRIGIRVLAGQYLALRAEPVENYIGMICSKTSPSEVVQLAANDARLMCLRRYGRAPQVEIIGCLDLTFPYIPSYLRYVVLELLKNALRATAETHENARTLPDVTVIIADGTENEDVVIKISDQGGGIARSQMDKIWSYLFTTADPKIQEAFVDEKDHSNLSPIAGFGYGLPISRSYCRYFGGDLDIMSMEGYGTDVFLYLKRLGDSKEPIPV